MNSIQKKFKALFFLLFLSTSYALSQQIADPVDFVKNIMKKYSPESYYIIIEDDTSPRVYEFDGEVKMEFTSVNDMAQFIESNQMPGILNDINTAVHETTHDYTSVIAYKLLQDRGIGNIGTNNYSCFAPDKNNQIVVKMTKSFPSSEINTVVDVDFQTERFATYVYPSTPTQGTQVHGVYGLLDEFHAYYHGTKAIVDLMPFFENELDQTSANWILYFRNVYSTYIAHAEFKLFILKYLIYAQEKHPDLFEKTINNKEFKEAFIKTDKAFSSLIADFNENKETIFNKLKQKGMKVIETDDRVTIENVSAVTLSETYNFFLQALKGKEYTDMMAVLSSTKTISQNEENTKSVNLQFDATSMVESFGSINNITVIGSFNEFDVSDTRFTMAPVSSGSSIFSITMKLKPGKYLYKLNIDGMFLNDMTSAGSMLTPAPEQFEKDNEGGASAVLIVN